MSAPATMHYMPALQRPEKVSNFLKLLMFGIGLMLPMISFSRSRGLSAHLVDRIAAVDVLCALAICALLASGRLRIHVTQVVYLGALLLAFGLGMAFDPGMTTITEMAALLMAVLYLLLGESTARSPVLVRALLTGMVIGALGEAVVVVHDFFLPMWFPDRHPSRVRGTFRASGQLAQYGFTVAGILLTFGWTYFQRNWTRLAVVAAGFLGAFFVVAASRRSGMFALAVWLGLFLLLGLRSASRRAYMGVMAASFLGLVALIVRANEGAGSYIVDRFLSALEGAVSGDSYVHQQFNVIMSNLDVWLPIGTGIGNGHLALTRDGVITAAEIHNGHLALAVELGLLGLIAFYILCARALCRRWEPAPAGVKYARAVKPVFLAFVLAATVFMIHNRLHRDRGFALFLGLAPTVAVAGGLAEKQQRPGPHRASGGWRVTGGG